MFVLTLEKNRVRQTLSELRVYCQQSQQNALTDHTTQLPRSFRPRDACKTLRGTKCSKDRNPYFSVISTSKAIG
jgi:hypothetical protein